MQQNISLQATAQELGAIYSLAEYYRSAQDMKEVDKLLIVYFVYDKSNQRFLNNLHALGAAILSPALKLTPKIEDDPDDQDSKIRSYEAAISDIRKAGIKVDYIKVNKDLEQQNLRNIRLYESQVNGQQIRVVTLPIDKNLIDISEMNVIRAKIDQFDRANYARQQRQFMKGQVLTKFVSQCQAIQKKMVEEECIKMGPKHENMFNIEALFHIIRQKTSKISVCSLVSAKQFKEETKIINEIKSLFEIPSSASQTIVHTLTNLTNTQSLKIQKLVSSIYTFKGKQITCPKNQCFNDGYYTDKPLQIKTKIYSLMNDARNQFMATIIQQFCKTWSSITASACTCIAAVLKRVYQKLEYGDDLTSSLISRSSLIESNEDISKDLKSTVFYTFSQIFYKFKINDLKSSLRENSPLQEFYTRERLGKVVLQKGEKLSQNIELISFIHFFQKINKQFLNRFPEVEKKDYKQLFNFVLQHLKTVYQLVNTINNKQQQDIWCENMSTYYNLLDFLFQSSTLIRSITGRELAICGSVKSLFDQLKSKQNRLLTFILSQSSNIREDQPIHYYDLYLKIVKENSKNIDNKIDYIYLLIHLRKADKISKQYSYNKQRVVQAIKSYSQIIYQYPKLPQTKKQEIKKLQIEKKIARLLLLVGLPQEAIYIYQKNHLVKSVEKCYKQLLMNFNGDKKAKKYIEFGQYFQKQFSYYRAIDYYESAFEVAKSKEVRMESIRQKIECQRRIRAQKEEDTKDYARYYKGQGTQDQFMNQISGEEDGNKTSIFSRLRNKLRWQQATGASVINEGNSVEESMIQ